MENSVETLCNMMARTRVLDAPAVRNLRQRWLNEARNDAGNSDKFGKWMVSNSYLTEFQLGLLLKGSADMLVFDQYTLQDRIGQGRMAGVYRAVHPSGQAVAIKVLPPSRAANAQLLARFQREARMATRLDHPNVVRTFDHGTTRAGLHYLVMEFLVGESLDDVLKRRKTITPVEAVYLGAQLLEGLQHLFEEGLVHRDLKPGNVMLVGEKVDQADTTFGKTAKILDIGLGRALFDEGAADNADLTTEGSILGTPSYMAPEQARNARSADIRADIYSLGCVLYTSLAGTPPFQDSNFMKQILRHATEPPRPLRELNPSVPDELWLVIETMLAKDTAQRYSTPLQAVKALRAAIPAVPEPPKPPEPTPKLRSYLTCLATEKKSDPDGMMANPAPQARAVVDAPIKPPAPSPKPSGQFATPALPVALPAPPSAVPAPAQPAAVDKESTPNARLEAVKATPVAPGSVSFLPEPSTTALLPPSSQGQLAEQAETSPPTKRTLVKIGPLKLSRRDLTCAGIGACVLLVLEGILWMMLRHFTG